MNLVFITSSVEPESPRGVAPLRDLIHIIPFVVSSLVGGTAAAAVIAGIGSPLAVTAHPASLWGSVEVWLVIAASLLVIQLQLLGRVAPLPEFHRQVPRRWLRWRRPVTGAAYGFILGAGAFTHLRYATMYTLALGVLVAPAFITACALGAVYGATRGLTLLDGWRRARRNCAPAIHGLRRRDSVLLGVAALGLPAWFLIALIT